MPDILLFDWRLDKAIENDPKSRFTPRFPKVKSVQDGIKKKISDNFKGKLVEAPSGA